jgi:nucleoside 2-deoxyribosyltransferase
MNANHVYLAGPSVFRPDAAAVAAELKRLCAVAGLVGLYPLDGDHPIEPRSIFKANLAKIDLAAAVIADLSPFRGPHVDDGTAFEIGYAFARGKPVFGYGEDTRPMVERIAVATVGKGGRRFCELGHEIEDFGLGQNLMLACAVRSVSQSAEDAIRAAAAHLRRQP